ncbi:MAG: hypothetical protein NTU47_10830 [Ignavibacteriales bacterium]|nr:hypothetical protein [Ignavibacteriales bacterium]
MHRFLVFLTLLAIFLQLGCHESTQPSLEEIAVLIELESAFKNDLVTLTLDNKMLLESRITTNDVLSLAWSSGFLKLSKESHSLHFAVVEFGAYVGYTIDLSNDTSTVAIGFDRSSKQIHLQQFKGRLLRD